MEIKNRLIPTRPLVSVGNQNQLKKIKSLLSPNKHVAIENFGQHLM
jgi:hypothetical protein